MKKGIKIALVIFSLLCFAMGIYLLVLSIIGKGDNYILVAALGLTALGNFLNVIALNKPKQ